MRLSRLTVGLPFAVLVLAGCSGSPSPSAHSSRPATSAAARTTSVPTVAAPSTRSRRTVPPPTRRSKPRPPASRATPTRPSGTHSGPLPASASHLPLGFGTGAARQVITVTAPSAASTTGTLRTWHRTAHGWRPAGPSVPAHLGSDGLTTRPSESLSATPVGSFTLTHAFGRDANPGTALPYVRTTPDDWWISQPGPLYNTRQRCTAHCSFTQGAPNEHLYYETPYYDYAVVIDYNTRNAPGGVRQGAGSAFFLHVTVGQPTQGCVSIPAPDLVRILRWLRPTDHPRILIGVG